MNRKTLNVLIFLNIPLKDEKGGGQLIFKISDSRGAARADRGDPGGGGHLPLLLEEHLLMHQSTQAEYCLRHI